MSARVGHHLNQSRPLNILPFCPLCPLHPVALAHQRFLKIVGVAFSPTFSLLCFQQRVHEFALFSVHKKVACDSPGLVDIAIGLVICVPPGEVFKGNSNYISSAYTTCSPSFSSEIAELSFLRVSPTSQVANFTRFRISLALPQTAQTRNMTTSMVA